MSTLYMVKELILRKEIRNKRILHQINIIENYIRQRGGCELVEEIADDAIYIYSTKRIEYLLRIDMTDININK